MSTKKRTAILISGRGSNMQSLVEASRAADYPAEIVLVASNRPEAPGIAWAKAQGLRTAIIDHKHYPSRAVFEGALQAILDEQRVELVALAGFMRLMTPAFVEHWRDRMINIHPSLLPSFKGLHTHERAIEAGVKITGCTVHFVRPEMDEGPIIAQAAVPVLPGDSPETLAARVLAIEHRVYPAALRLVAAGQVPNDQEKVTINQHSGEMNSLFSPVI
ncbi:phosphoribosylglycinamide formyltransferase [Hyphomicrobium facile]|uniref:Phosphoribosylglycinamide formyltransferase n=1 Tax=Hyphomicrobium facile TaxID=51670 RepID=A0A1I7NQ99_9HYPH|nr:phosphoribosylglycinamide formyltransferase [Hyphomicrobium facile]SFV36846.1 phosphoribosylglycinamide formyltransferase-1 [Hyphomicrobium facile]